ncbi:MAG TPA: response regulator [Polyangia bacterium]|jgi:CheY-like chemotaxis protein
MTVDVTKRPQVESPGPARRSDVLLVEDDELVRFALRRVLAANHRPSVAISSVEEAQQVLTVHRPSLVLTDYNLAGHWTGIDLVLWMRRQAWLRDVPAVLMTGGDVAEVRERLTAVGLDRLEVIAKPFEPADLIAALDRASNAPDPQATGRSR